MKQVRGYILEKDLMKQSLELLSNIVDPSISVAVKLHFKLLI